MKTTPTQRVASYPEGQRIWLVRASGGKHLNNFIKHGIVAISHIDKAITKEKLITPPNPESLKAIIYKYYSDTKPKENTEEYIDEELTGEIPDPLDDSEDNPEKNTSTESRIHQASSFITKINIGDLIVSLNKENIAIGVCTSGAHIKYDTLKHTTITSRGKTKTETLDYKLRRDVTWLNPIPRQLAGSTLRKPLLARKTISNLDDHWDKVYSLVYPAFTRGDLIYLSNRINSTSSVGTRSVSRLLEFVADTQVIADAIIKKEFNESLIKLLTEGSDIPYQDRAVSQAEFMSPGNIYHIIEALKGVPPKKYAQILMLLLSIGLYGCSENPEDSSSISKQLSSLLNQRDMTDERNDEVSKSTETDAMLQQFREYSKSKGIDKIAKSLDVTVGINDTNQSSQIALQTERNNRAAHPSEHKENGEPSKQIALEFE